MNKDIIIVTDGDRVAQRAVEVAAQNLGVRCISASAGNPTEVTGPEMESLILSAKSTPVVIMIDDVGKPGIGKGEGILGYLLKSQNINILGIIAIASNNESDYVEVDCSITKEGEIIKNAVDKFGDKQDTNKIKGDTLSIINQINQKLIIVGLGDPGKMDFNDDISKGAPITTKAIEQILKSSKNQKES
ncbi:MAG: stage V sporulation protein AE [Clostridia bacterium]|nr:stage V sporulation protein AE [Clostridia bacterium]